MIRDVEPTHGAASPDVRNGRAGRSVIAAIGIDAYAAWPRLDRAVSDAAGVSRVFQELGFVAMTEPLYNAAATARAMHSLVVDDLAQLSPDDSLVVFFAGHGHTRTHPVGEVRVQTGYVIPSDAASPGGNTASWLRLDTWLSDIARLPPRHILVIIDACHSGIALGSLIKWRATEPPRGAIDELHRRVSRRIITSALADQFAMDGGPYPQHSLFTGCLIEGLRGAIADRGRPGTIADRGRQRVTGSEIGLYVQHRVGSYPASRQTPDFGALELDDRGEMVIPLLGVRPTRAEPAVPISINTESAGPAPDMQAPAVPAAALRPLSGRWHADALPVIRSRARGALAAFRAAIHQPMTPVVIWGCLGLVVPFLGLVVFGYAHYQLTRGRDPASASLRTGRILGAIGSVSPLLWTRLSLAALTMALPPVVGSVLAARGFLAARGPAVAARIDALLASRAIAGGVLLPVAAWQLNHEGRAVDLLAYSPQAAAMLLAAPIACFLLGLLFVLPPLASRARGLRARPDERVTLFVRWAPYQLVVGLITLCAALVRLGIALGLVRGV
jgi:uncharacterized caspase-like protein